MAQLINTANVSGDYLDVPLQETTRAVVELTALSITKEADKQIWVNGELGYRIVVTNLDEADPGDPVTDVIITDTIDPTYASLLEATLEVTVGGVVVTDPDYTYDPATGLLTINVDTLPAGESIEVTFRVAQA